MCSFRMVLPCFVCWKGIDSASPERPFQRLVSFWAPVQELLQSPVPKPGRENGPWPENRTWMDLGWRSLMLVVLFDADLDV